METIEQGVEEQGAEEQGTGEQVTEKQDIRTDWSDEAGWAMAILVGGCLRMLGAGDLFGDSLLRHWLVQLAVAVAAGLVFGAVFRRVWRARHDR